jgi:hypothetical protein
LDGRLRCPLEGRFVRASLAILLAICACADHGHEAAWRAQVGSGDPRPRAQDISETEYPPFSEGIFPCSRCHVGGEPDPVPERGFPHQAHLDADLECADCHFPEEEAEPVLPTAESCLDCHEDDESEAYRAYAASVAGESGAFRYARRWQAENLRAAHPKHAAAEVECAACHGAPGNLPYVKPRTAVLMRSCMACHEQRGAPNECATCHPAGIEPPHADIVLDHAEEQRGCLDCHNPENWNTLRLANGTALPFEKSYRLCGQCHGPHLRDWRLGLHGKRTGSWDGHKKYLLCVHCHNPHAPRFREMKLLDRPPRPEEIR